MSKRKPFTVGVGLLAVLFGVVARAEKPNIVIIYADDMGYGEVQALNPDRCIVPTPHLDRLVAEGLSFDNGHSGASVCTPSRYALLTGRYAWRSPRTKGVGGGPNGCLIDADRLTIAGFLGQNGYDTCMIGKWHQGFSCKSDLPKSEWPKANKNQTQKNGVQLLPPVGATVVDSPVTRGFDHFFGFDSSGTMSTLVDDERVVKHVDFTQVMGELTRHATDYVKQRKNEKEPFFLYLPLNSPHLPVSPSSAWQGKSAIGSYGDFVMETDAAVGTVMDALRETELLENTLVIFSSDNGFADAGERVNRKLDGSKVNFHEVGHYPSAGWRDSKASLFEGGHRVPFIVRWPEGGVQSGTHSEALVCQTDFMATFAELLDESVPENAGEDSTSILAAMRGAPQARDHVVHHSFRGRFAITQGNWKLLFAPMGYEKWNASDEKEATLPPIQLYNLKDDPAEQNDLSAQFPEKVTSLTRLMDTLVVEGRSTPGTSQSNDRPINYRVEPKEQLYKKP